LFKIHRYTWEPDFQLCLTDQAKSKTTIISFSEVLSHDALPIMQAVQMVDQLLSNAKELRSVSSKAQLPTSFYTSAAITMPRDLIHVSFTNLDSRQLDLYLLVETTGKEVSSDCSTSHGTLSDSTLDEELNFSIRYNQTLFAPESMEAMMRCWETLFENAQVSGRAPPYAL